MSDEPTVKQTVSPAAQGNINVPTQVGGSLNKEIEPGNVSEFLTPSTPELELPEDVERAGVMVTPDHPKLTQIERRAGIEPAKESVPISNVPVVKLSALSDEERANMKASPITDSRRFRITLYELIMKRIKEGLVRLGG